NVARIFFKLITFPSYFFKVCWPVGSAAVESFPVPFPVTFPETFTADNLILETEVYSVNRLFEFLQIALPAGKTIKTPQLLFLWCFVRDDERRP
ncbi:MAG: hypothetical protein IKD68_12315, partial [Solobacterium sp.]|nr:hypothetical protein [Solobacterium sp.]